MAGDPLLASTPKLFLFLPLMSAVMLQKMRISRKTVLQVLKSHHFNLSAIEHST